MIVTPLGTASHYPKPGNACSGYLVQEGGASIWLDAGPGTLGELQRGVALADLSAVWISHAHADHTADLLPAYYAYRFGDVGPRERVPLLAPDGLHGRLAAFLGGSAVEGLGEVFGFVDLSAEGAARFGDVRLTWRPVGHDVPGFAVRIESADGVLVYSGDTGPCAAIDELATGCDVLLCEAGDAVRVAGERAVHLTPEEAGAVAAAAGAGRLVLTHLALGLDRGEAVARAAAVFDGPVEVAEPGRAIRVGRHP